LAAGLCPDPLGQLTALPRPLASSIKKGGDVREMGMIERRKGKAKRKVRSREIEGNLE